jgi:hypothetical protein
MRSVGFHGLELGQLTYPLAESDESYISTESGLDLQYHISMMELPSCLHGPDAIYRVP